MLRRHTLAFVSVIELAVLAGGASRAQDEQASPQDGAPPKANYN